MYVGGEREGGGWERWGCDRTATQGSRARVTIYLLNTKTQVVSEGSYKHFPGSAIGIQPRGRRRVASPMLN